MISFIGQGRLGDQGGRHRKFKGKNNNLPLSFVLGITFPVFATKPEYALLFLDMRSYG